MSGCAPDEHYRSVLVWIDADARHRYISCMGVKLMLRVKPFVPGISPFAEIEYALHSDKHRKAVQTGRWKPLTRAECSEIEAWLGRWAQNARSWLWDGKTERRGMPR